MVLEARTSLLQKKKKKKTRTSYKRTCFLVLMQAYISVSPVADFINECDIRESY